MSPACSPSLPGLRSQLMRFVQRGHALLTLALRSTFGKLVVGTSVILVVSSLCFYHLELRPKGQADLIGALYWSVVTVTTVGYGDMVPTSVPGRVLGMLVMLSGIGLVSTLSGNLASLLVERNVKKRKGMLQVRLTKHFVLIGWNAYAPGLIRSLMANLDAGGADLVLVNELNEETRNEIAFELDLGKRLHFVVGNPTQKNVVSKASPNTAQAVFILCQAGLDPKDADQQSIYSALTVRSQAPKVPLLGEVILPQNREHLLRAGVNELLPRGEVSSNILGMMGAAPSVWPFFQSMLGIGGRRSLHFRQLGDDERAMLWGDFTRQEQSQTGNLPLALCRESKKLTLKDMLDEGQALDKFILELFEMTGRGMEFGQQGPQVLVNPHLDQPLEHYDAILYLEPGPARHESVSLD